MPPELGQRVFDPFDVGRRIAGKLRRSEEWNVGAVMPRNGRRLLGIGRHDDRLEDPAFDRRGDRIGDDRVSAKPADVLGGHAFGTLARRNQRNGTW
jgi:hypothetical protein